MKTTAKRTRRPTVSATPRTLVSETTASHDLDSSHSPRRLPGLRKIAILRVINKVTATSAPYNQFSLPLADQHDITLCTYYKSSIPAAKFKVFEGDGTWKGFFRALKEATRLQEFDLVHIHSPFVAFLLFSARLRLRWIPSSTVITLHNSFRNFKFRNRLLILPALALGNAVVCCGQSSFESIPRFYRWLAGNRLYAIQNGVNLERIDRVIDAEPRRNADRPFTIVSIGRLKSIKNPVALLRAFQQVSHGCEQLNFVGDGELRFELEREVESLGVGHRVSFSGLIPRDDVYRTLVRSTLFVSASKGEGLPIAALEAMACRCPVLLSDIPPHREIAKGTDAIRLVSSHDSDAWAHEIKRFLQMPLADRAEIGEKCRRHVEARFSLTAMHRSYRNVYEHVMRQRSRTRTKEPS